MSEEGVQKFYTDDVSLPRFGKYFSLFEANFLHGTTNQKHNLDRPLVSNFYVCSANIISWVNQSWHQNIYFTAFYSGSQSILSLRKD